MMLKSTHGRLAKLRYGLADYVVIQPGDHVLCAVTGAAIALDALRYWSAEAQEAYASAEVSTRRHLERAAT